MFFGYSQGSTNIIYRNTPDAQLMKLTYCDL